MTWLEQSQPFQEIIECFSKVSKDVYFIQIGCCDGVVEDIMHDLIVKNRWTGILIEPVKYLFEKLKANYQGYPNVIFRNVAISSENGVRDFWYIRDNNEGLPFWYDQIGSFFPEVVLKHISEIPNLREYLVKEKVDCITLETLIQQHHIKKIDIIHIDVEGYDFGILKQIDFEKFCPSIVVYEHKHLIESDQKDSWNYLRSKGYQVIYNYMDTIAFIGDFVDSIIIEKLKASHLFFM